MWRPERGGEGAHPLARAVPAFAGHAGVQVVLPVGPAPAALQLALEGVGQVLRRAGHSPGGRDGGVGRQLAHQVGGGLRAARGGLFGVHALAAQLGLELVGEALQGGGGVGLHGFERGLRAEQLLHLQGRTGAALQRVALVDEAAVLPVQQRQRALRGAPGQQARAVLHAHQDGGEAGRVFVVHAFLVALLVARRGEGAHALQQRRGLLGRGGLHRAHQRGPVQPLLAAQRRLHQTAREVFGTAQLGRLGHQGLVPARPVGVEPRILHRGHVVGAGDLEAQPALAGHE